MQEVPAWQAVAQPGAEAVMHRPRARGRALQGAVCQGAVTALLRLHVPEFCLRLDMEAKRQSLGVHSFQTSCGVTLPLIFKPGRHSSEKPRTLPLSPRMFEGLNISCRHLWLKCAFLHFSVLPLKLLFFPFTGCCTSSFILPKALLTQGCWESRLRSYLL